MNIYQRAKRYGVQFETSCIQSDSYTVERLMQGAKRANRKEVINFALEAGIISKEEANKEKNRRYYNPYKQLKTRTHLIYVNSAVEYFIKINH